MRKYDDEGRPVYCEGSGTPVPGSAEGARARCPLCGDAWVRVTAKSALRKHFARHPGERP